MKLAKRPRRTAALLDSPHVTALFEKVRVATGDFPLPPPLLRPMPQRTVRTKTVALGLALSCVLAWWCFHGSRSPWIGMTIPGASNGSNVVTGQTSLYNGDFFHDENFDSLRQLDLIKGEPAKFAPRTGFDDRRIGYAVLGNLFTLAVNACHAFSALNLVLYWLCAVLAAGVSESVFGDRAKSLLASALFVFSIAATVHVGDLSPHLLGMMFSYLWTLLLLRIEMNARPIGWRSTIGMSALLGAWSLADASSLYGLAVYALYLLKRRKGLSAVLPALACFGLPYGQQMIFEQLGVTVTCDSVVELARRGLEQHWTQLLTDPARYAGFLALELVDYLFNDNPLNVLIAVVGLILLRHRAKWLLSACYFTPIAVAFIFLPTTAARGYAVAGNTVVVFVLVSHFAIEFSRRLRPEFGGKMAAFSIVSLLAVQLIWGYSSLDGWLYPASSYGFGILKNAGTLLPAEFAKMSGPIDARPTSVGGTVAATIPSGLPEGFGQERLFPVRRLEPYLDNWSGLSTMLSGLKIQSPLLACLVVAVIFLSRWRWSLLLVPVLAGWIGAAQIFAGTGRLDPKMVRKFDDRISIEADEKLVGRVQLSQAFREKLERAGRTNERVEFAIRLHERNGSTSQKRTEAAIEFQVAECSSDQPRFSVPASSFLDAVTAHNGRVEFSIAPQSRSRGVFVHSWQALDSTEGREAALIHPDGTRMPIDWFPSFEIRIVRSRPAYSFNGLIDQFDASQSTGYVLIGF